MTIPALSRLWLALAAAPFIGSFLGVLIRRLPDGRPVVRARSCCETCGHTLGPADLVPIFSHVARRGRCRYCGAPIARMHLAVELAALLVPLSAGLAGITDPATLWTGCLLGWTLLALGWIDALHFLLPDLLTLPLIALGLLQCLWLTPENLADHALAAALGWLTLRGVALAYRALRHRDGLGAGDAKLFAAAGAWTGVAALPMILLAAALLGLLYAALCTLRGRRVTSATRLPFGPMLAAALWLLWLARLTPP